MYDIDDPIGTDGGGMGMTAERFGVVVVIVLFILTFTVGFLLGWVVS